MAQKAKYPERGHNAPVIFTVAEIEQTAIGDLSSYDNNPRAHAARDIARLADAIRAFGFVVPILVESDGTIIAGHGRLEAAKTLGMRFVPTVRADHLSRAQARALRIADNRLAELSDWDRDALRIEFADLAELSLEEGLNFDLEITGFELPEIDLLLCSEDDATDEATETVEEPDRTGAPVTQPGDLWILGDHRILCADALDETSYATLLEGDVARMVFTDPPYNVAINGHVRCGATAGHREFAMASGEMSDAEFRAFLASIALQLVANLAEGGIAMVCMDWRHVEELIAAGKATGLALINLCVWNKTNGGMGGLYRSKHELVLVFRKPGAPHINNVELGRHGRNRTNVWDYPGVNSFRAGRKADLVDHPTVKPTALVADAILDVSHRGDIVLDAFGGSGSTLLAAEKTGRRARLIELDPAYVDVAIRRWQETTGRTATHAVTGESWEARAATRAADIGEADDDDA